MIQQWRNDIIRYFQHGHGERIPVMMLGLKRDLRKEGEGIIYPQEVCDGHTNRYERLWLILTSRLIGSPKNFAAIGMPNAPL